MSTPNFLLSNGKNMPIVGLGTWRSPPEVVTQAVKDAVDIGYRHFDCAHIYGNEAQVGAALREKIDEGVVTRDQLFITSKLWNTHHKPELVRPACETSMRNLGVDYLDLYLMHWPMAYKSGDVLYPTCPDTNKAVFEDIDYVDTWRAMEDLVDEGLCQAIGVSNFNEQQITRLLSLAKLKPVVLQIECHPYLSQKPLITLCYDNAIAVTAYSCLGSGHTPYEKPGAYPLLQHPTILAIAEKYERTPAQVLLRYQTQSGIIVIPRSVSKHHMQDNFKRIWDFGLAIDDIKAIHDLDCNGRFMTMKAAYGHPHHPFEPVQP
ncbi:aldo-keto reductase family 1 member B1 [Drosophila ficusphila]|uniref:aldo-keto reductase family 1 member B1 n=1 Tax=Drosophila ficusphila TaxID=30025 RepID=UPI0007E64FFE|nr:aldo-keto reductase family 1 member B1 [Drosophila ficusphila]XP_017059743.1 aldo-keto reductase family 1 member B1 [Drosophila ficusphila]